MSLKDSLKIHSKTNKLYLLYVSFLNPFRGKLSKFCSLNALEHDARLTLKFPKKTVFFYNTSCVSGLQS